MYILNMYGLVKGNSLCLFRRGGGAVWGGGCLGCLLFKNACSGGLFHKECTKDFSWQNRLVQITFSVILSN